MIPCEYDQIRWTGDLFIVYQSTRDTDGDEKEICGAFNTAGERILPLEYDDWYNKGNANSDYYVFTKEYEEDVSVQVVLSKTGEKLGEYVVEYKGGDECLGWIECPEEDNEVIVLGKDGQVAARWEYEEMRRDIKYWGTNPRWIFGKKKYWIKVKQ